jgi:pilus assembly protein CpaE
MRAFTRYASARSKTRSTGKARVFTVINAKGGSGATTLAVNTAVALQQNHGQTILVDFSPIGHAALHLNARPSFSVVDAMQNLHRMDASLLEGLMTSTKDGLHLLAAPQQPYAAAPAATELARLFDLLVSHYRYVVVDCSGRMDQTTRLLSDLSNAVLMVAQTDVVSLWSAGRIRIFLEEGNARNRLRLIMNRYKKIPGFTEEEIEKVTNCKILWKIPNNYQLIAPAIDKGAPVATHDNQEVSRAFRSLADMLALAPSAAEEGLDLVFQPEKDVKKKAANRLLISPIRAGQ